MKSVYPHYILSFYDEFSYSGKFTLWIWLITLNTNIIFELLFICKLPTEGCFWLGNPCFDFDLQTSVHFSKMECNLSNPNPNSFWISYFMGKSQNARIKDWSLHQKYTELNYYPDLSRFICGKLAAMSTIGWCHIFNSLSCKVLDYDIFSFMKTPSDDGVCNSYKNQPKIMTNRDDRFQAN